MSILQQLILILALTGILAVFETWRPIETKQPWSERLGNLFFMFVYLIIGGAATIVLSNILQIEPPLVRPRGVAESLFVILAAIFVWDFLFYWYHRAEHRFIWLWIMHRFHHADEHLNASSAMRHVWLENPIQNILIGVTVAYLLQLDAVSIFLFGIITTIWLMFVHANWKLSLGFLTPAIGGPQVHRIHHSILNEHRGKNFAVYFPVIDKIFGTYYAPGPDEFPPTGTN